MIHQTKRQKDQFRLDHQDRKRDGSEKRSSENLIRQRGQRNDLNPGEFASRAGVRVVVLARAGGRAGFQRAACLSPGANQSAAKFCTNHI